MKHLYKRVCPSVRRLVHLSVCPLCPLIFGGIDVLLSTAWPVLALVLQFPRCSETQCSGPSSISLPPHLRPSIAHLMFAAEIGQFRDAFLCILASLSIHACRFARGNLFAKYIFSSTHFLILYIHVCVYLSVCMSIIFVDKGF